MASNFDDVEAWHLGDELFHDSVVPTISEAESWAFSMEGSPDPNCSALCNFRADSDPCSDIFGKSLISFTADRVAASRALERLILHEEQLTSVTTPSSSDCSSSSAVNSRKRARPSKSDDFQIASSASKSLGSFGSSSSSAETFCEILSSVSPPLPRNLSLLTDEQRNSLQSIVASRRLFLSKNRKKNLENIFGERLNSEEEILSHVIRTFISKIPRDHSRLQLDQNTQALRHFIEMQLCIPFENFLITDAKLPGTDTDSPLKFIFVHPA
jgi:hypothetical protein